MILKELKDKFPDIYEIIKEIILGKTYEEKEYKKEGEKK